MILARDGYLKCPHTPLRQRSQLFLGKEKKCNREELLGRYKGLCGRKLIKAKQNGKDGWQMDMTQCFREHTLEENASEFSDYPKAKGWSGITLHKIWFVAWKDSSSKHKPVLSPGAILTNTKLFSFLYICTAWFYSLYIWCIHSSSALLSVPNSMILLGHSLLFLIIIIQVIFG